MSSMEHNKGPLPEHDQLGWFTRFIELSCIVAAIGLAAAQMVRFARADLTWWSVAPVLFGLVFADFVSGIVHWTADTWGSETMPILGRRFVRPFRVHHVNPDDFLRRDPIDTNGDVAMIVIPLLIIVSCLPIERFWPNMLGLFLLAFSICGLPTNQVHQWAHMPTPPTIIRTLQKWRIILSQADHERHHDPPHVRNYCITTGWCNPLLTAIDFFPRLERLVTLLTRLSPRNDDESFSSQARLVATKNETAQPTDCA